MTRKLVLLFFISALIFGGANHSVAATLGVQTGMSHCVANQALPDPRCTPGAVLTTNVNIICVPGYTKTVRDVPLSVKKRVFSEYDIPWNLRSNYEVDHLISLEIGGSNDISNLWPESNRIGNGALVKDKVENYLHKQVCNGSITIQQAQQEIATNWLYYDQLRKNPPIIAPVGNVAPMPPAPLPPIINTLPSIQPQPAPPATPPTPPTIYTPIEIQPQPAASTAPVLENSSEPQVKKSKNDICHEIGSTYYSRTIHYTPYDSMQACLDSGGRLPLR